MKKLSIYLLVFTVLMINVAATIPIEQWKTYVFKSAGFKMSFPEKPELSQQANGQVFNAVVESEGTIYKVMARIGEEFDLSLASALLLEAEKALLQKGDKVILRKNLKVGDYNAREIHLRSPDGLTLVYRGIITKTGLYQMVISRYNDFPDKTRINKFLDSFEFVKK